MVYVCNLRNEKPQHEYDFHIDRKSIFGNPFYMKNESYRDYVCDKYEDLKDNDDNFVKDLQPLIKAHKKYGKVRLFCWCSPKRCHGDYIKKRLLEELKIS